MKERVVARMPRKMLSIIVCAHGNPHGLRRLVAAYLQGNFRSTELIIKISGRCNEMSRVCDELAQIQNIVILSTPDAGLYEGLNQAIAIVQSPYYMVYGCDDTIDIGGVRNAIDLLSHRDGDNDFHVFGVKSNGGQVALRRYLPLSVGVGSFVTSHSVGLAIPMTAHKAVGLYDESYEILSDSKFLTQALRSGFAFVEHLDVITGEFAQGGISTTNHALRIKEAYRYQLELGSFMSLQVLFLAYRWISIFFKRWR